MPEVRTLQEAVASVRSGQRIFVHGSAATPLALLRALFERAGELSRVELVSISTLGHIGLDRPEVQRSFFMNSLFVSENVRDVVNGPYGEYVPVFLSENPPHVRARRVAAGCGLGPSFTTGSSRVLFLGRVG